MIKTILLCADGSHYSETATEAAIWLTKNLKTQLRILSVADTRVLEGPWFSDLIGTTGLQPFQALVPQIRELSLRKAETVADAVAKTAKKNGVNCKKTVSEGLLVDEILAAERSCELVVMGQRGEGFEGTGEWLGTHVERVVRKSIKPCLITPLKFSPIKSILAAYDGSEHANHALYAAFELTKALKAQLTLLTVETVKDEEEKSLILEEGLELAAKQKIKAHAEILHATHPEDKILEVAEDQKFDLIVMGAYGHTRLRELTLGSATNHVIRKSPVPVLLAR